MRKAVLAVLAVASLAVGVYGLQRKLGPEWTKVGNEYHRKVEVKFIRSVGGNVSGCTLRLERDEVFVWEVDDNRGFTVGSHPYGELRVVKGEKDQATE